MIPVPPVTKTDTLSSTLSLVKNKFVGVDDASAISSKSSVMLADPLKDTPFIVRAVSNVVAVSALPVRGPVIPAKVTLSPVPTA